MPDLRVGLLKGIVEAFAHVVQARGKQRESVFETVVQGRFETLRHIHRSFHSSLGPVRTALTSLERELRTESIRVKAKLTAFSALVRELEADRYLGRPTRRELFESCQFLARSGFRFSSLTEPLDQIERQLVTLFMNDVCAYFASNDSYEHEYGNTVAALLSLSEMWLAERAPSAEDAADTRARLDGVIARMEERWAKVIRDFSRLEASVRNNVSVDSDDLDPPSALLSKRVSSAVAPTLLIAPYGRQICAA
jgi:hypothetical protein